MPISVYEMLFPHTNITEQNNAIDKKYCVDKTTNAYHKQDYAE